MEPKPSFQAAFPAFAWWEVTGIPHLMFLIQKLGVGCVFWGKIIFRKVEFPKT